ncbi:MAG: amino acid adenylation domain-containing protein [Bacteroidia bacterium]
MIKGVLDLLEQSAKQFAHKTAFKDTEGEIDFKTLQDHAQRIGSFLAISIESNYSRPIIVFVERKFEPIVAFMGVHYSGNFYVPVDNKTPESRLKGILDVLDPIGVIGFSAADKSKIEKLNLKLQYFDYQNLISGEIYSERLDAIRRKSIDTDPAYAIFTSGSTGLPKAVAINQRSVLDLSYWLCDTFSFHHKEIIGNQTPFYFDASVKDIYISLRTGATLYVIPHRCFSFPKTLAETLVKERISSILWATSAVVLTAKSGILDEVDLPDLKKVFFAGEAMFGRHLNIWRSRLPNCEYINLYGPTEITVDCTYFKVNREFKSDEVIPIGYACENKNVFILNEEGQPIQGNELGEIAVRGTGLAIGYYNNAEQTRKVFVQSPYHNHYTDLIYKTGDNGRVNEYGEIEFVGRQDFQIKHMGNRIELGEIEAAVYSMDDIYQTVASYDQKVGKIILFYTADKEISASTFLKQLSKSLPKYMFPNKFIHLPEMPMNPNGKIDRNRIKTEIDG